MQQPVAHNLPLTDELEVFITPYIAQTTQLSHEKKPALLFMKSWLVNRDPYFMVYSLNNWVVFHPLYGCFQK